MTESKTDGGTQRRKLYVILCPSCGLEWRFRRPAIPSEGWECKMCKGRIDTNCANCGKSMTVRKSRLIRASTGNVFCDRGCKEATQVVGGIMALPHYGTGERHYRQKAITHYGARCFDCGEVRIHRLVVHHKDGNRDNNAIDNLEVLCRNHHADRHISPSGVFDVNYLTKGDSS